MREQAGLISVIVPVYGDGRDLDDLATRLRDVLDRAAAPWELILVNDGSPPPAWDRICRLAASCPSIRGIDLERNAGQHNALLAGIRASSGTVVVTMDDDLQHPPEEVPALLRQLHSSGDDVVYGTPCAPVHGPRRQVGGTLARVVVAWASGVPQARIVSAFRAFKGTLRPAFAHDEPQVFIDGVLCRASTRVSAVAVRHDPRRHGQSGYGFRSLITLAATMAGAFGVPRTRILELCAGGAAAIAGGMLVERKSMQPAARKTFAGLIIGAGCVLFGAGVACAYFTRRAAARGQGAGYAIRTTISLDP